MIRPSITPFLPLNKSVLRKMKHKEMKKKGKGGGGLVGGRGVVVGMCEEMKAINVKQLSISPVASK